MVSLYISDANTEVEQMFCSINDKLLNSDHLQTGTVSSENLKQVGLSSWHISSKSVAENETWLLLLLSWRQCITKAMATKRSERCRQGKERQVTSKGHEKDFWMLKASRLFTSEDQRFTMYVCQENVLRKLAKDLGELL